MTGAEFCANALPGANIAKGRNIDPKTIGNLFISYPIWFSRRLPLLTDMLE
jgi:hypothetical protein